MPPKAASAKKTTTQAELKKLREVYKKNKTDKNAVSFFSGIVGASPVLADYELLVDVIAEHHSALSKKFDEIFFSWVDSVFKKHQGAGFKKEVMQLFGVLLSVGVSKKLHQGAGKFSASSLAGESKFYANVYALLVRMLYAVKPVKLGIDRMFASGSQASSQQVTENFSDKFDGFFQAYLAHDDFSDGVENLVSMLGLLVEFDALKDKVLELAGGLVDDDRCHNKAPVVDWLVSYYKKNKEFASARTIQEKYDSHEDIRSAASALERGNKPLARMTFKKAAVDKKNKSAFAHYASMCYHGDGGPVDMEAAYIFAKKLTIAEVKPMHYLDVAEIYHVLSYARTGDRKVELKTMAKQYYEAVVAHPNLDEASKVKARLNLLILEPPADVEISSDDDSELASPAGSPVGLPGFDCETKEGRDLAITYLAAQGDIEGEPVFEFLKAYYLQAGNKYQLLTRYLLLARQGDQLGKKEVCKALLVSLFSEADVNFDDIGASYDLLKAQEAEANKYFDEDTSDDSDQEDYSAYEKIERHYCKSFDPKLVKAISAISGEAEKLLLKLAETQQAFDFLDKSPFVKSVIGFHPKANSVSKQIKKDAKTFCHGAQAKKSGGAVDLGVKLSEVGERSQAYYVSLVRGIHHDIKWSPTQRRDYRKRVRGKTLPPRIYSGACYKHAGVKYDEFSDLAMRRLALSEKYVHYRLRKLSDPPYKKADLPQVSHGFSKKEIKAMYDEMLTTKFKTKHQQVQQLYSKYYALFHKFIAWESGRRGAVFPNGGSPFVSAAGCGTIAPYEYAIGNKYYEGTEYSRLRPRYNEVGKPVRPYSGTVTLSLLKLEVFLQPHNHVPSMNRDAEIQVGQLIFPERETSFVASMPGEVVFSYNAKFPDFSQVWSEAVYIKYGMSEPLYEQFKTSLLSFKPHTDEQRMVINLLGRYLSAFHALLLQQEAVDWVRKQEDGFLFFRTPEGGFSEEPSDNVDIDPSPNGYPDRVETTRILREKRKRTADDAAGPAESSDTLVSPKSAKQPKPEGKQPLSAKARAKMPKKAEGASGGDGSQFGADSSAMYRTSPSYGNSGASGAGPAVPMEPG
jgi:hypothetical protein